MRQRFIEEAPDRWVASASRHRTHFYELGQFGDTRPCFTMKAGQGANFGTDPEATVLPGSVQDLLGVLQTFSQVCQTVAYAHSKHVIHRDLKPANIMIGDFGEVQVMDWGLAKVIAKPELTSDRPDVLVAFFLRLLAGEIKWNPGLHGTSSRPRAGPGRLASQRTCTAWEGRFCTRS